MRLLVINNMPAFYRTAPFSALIDAFTERTGGEGMVAYQVRRDVYGRGEWFYTPDQELPFRYHFSSESTARASRVTAYPPKIDPWLWGGYRPTHVFTAGWDSPLSLTAAAYARVRPSTTLGIWVESNPSTSERRGRLANRFRRTVLRSASFALVPTDASGEYVTELAGQSLALRRARNPVTLDRLADSTTRHHSRRMVFLGDLSRRKGFDVLCEALARTPTAWHGVAWGRDTEGLASQAPPNLVVRAAQPLHDIIPELRPDDILVIPSRVDPAPLTYSEGLALGLRILVSRAVAYSADARRVPGVTSIDPTDPSELVISADRALQGPRPGRDVSQQVRPEYWASQVLSGLGIPA